MGASVSEMKVVDHDEILAATSHLPHILAYALVDMLSSMRKNQEVFRYAAGGFSDFTRIAASDPVMWHDIVMANKKAITSALSDLTKHIDFIKQAISLGDSEYLLDVFAHARETRNHFDQMRENKTYLKPIAQTIDYRVSPGGCIKGKVVVPGDKSISHRAIILGSIANGVTNISGFLEGEDSLATLQAFRDMGVVIKRPAKGCVEIHGVGLNGLQAPSGPLYLGNSGTSMRLLSGLLAAQSFDVVLTGDESLSKRPMERVVTPLRKMGAVIAMNKNGLPPLKIKGGVDLKAIDYKLPMASAQVKSCILLAGLYAKGQTSTIESVATRDHTERMLAGFGYHVDRKEFSASLRGKGELKSTIVNVPADISSAAFYMVAASIAPGSDVILPHVGVNPTRIGVINILQMMGADIRLSNKKEVSGEPVADIQVRYAPLHGIEIPVDQVALAIDEFPVLFVAAACATGKTILRGALELRVKESDR
ncbi:MAG: 3-phosphoshikimate 1-carboxyvinyltransferase, partial [Porticoccus sp.]|nr:3-phosphoshikimate 1-carboxyvinyltransferase [Porticoccus sp.]